MSCHLIKRSHSRIYHGWFKLPTWPKAREESLRCTNKQVAQKRLIERYEELQLEAAGIMPPKALRETEQKELSFYLDEMIQAKASNRDDRYLAELKARVVRLCRECRWSNVASVTPDSFQLWRVARMSEGTSAKTLNEYLISIRSLLNWLVVRGRLMQNPMAGVELLPVYGMVRPRRALTDAEFQRLVAVSGERGLLYTFAAYTGLRYAEIEALEVRDLRLEERLIVVRSETTKNGRVAHQPLHDSIVAHLGQYVDTKGLSPQDRLFGGMSRKHFPKDAAKAGIALVGQDGRHVGFHSLRHTFCSWLQRSGSVQRVLMELMRHSDRRLTDRLYTDTALLPVRESINALPAVPQLPHILPHEIVPSSPVESQGVQEAISANGPERLINRGSSPKESFGVPTSPEWEMVRDTGFEYVEFTL